MASENPVMAAVGRLAAAKRWGKGVDEARNDLAAARLEREIERAVRPEDPDYAPLADADRERLAALLAP